MVFFSKQKVQVSRSYTLLKLIDFFFADDGYSLKSRKVLERLEDDDFGLSFEDESDFEGKGIYGYMPEADDARIVGMASRGELDYDEDMDDCDASSALSVPSSVVAAGKSVYTFTYYSRRKYM